MTTTVGSVDRRKTPEKNGHNSPITLQAASFAMIGVVSTVAYMALFAILMHPLGSQVANFSALSICAIANTAANRRFTFRISQRTSMQMHIEGFIVFLIGLGFTSATLFAINFAMPSDSGLMKLIGVTVANLSATASKFVLLRSWVFHPGRHKSQLSD